MHVLVPILNEADCLPTNLDALALRLTQALDEISKEGAPAPVLTLRLLDSGSSDGSTQLLRQWIDSRPTQTPSLQLVFEPHPKTSPGTLDRLSVGKRLNLTFKKISSERASDLTDLSSSSPEWFWVMPIDCFPSHSACVAFFRWLGQVPEATHYACFFKQYRHAPRGFRIYAHLQNWILLKLRRDWVWTNTPAFRLTASGTLPFPETGFLEDVLHSDALKRHPTARIKIFHEPIEVSPRRYLKRGILKQIFNNACVMALHRFLRGTVSVHALKKIYQS